MLKPVGERARSETVGTRENGSIFRRCFIALALLCPTLGNAGSGLPPELRVQAGTSISIVAPGPVAVPNSSRMLFGFNFNWTTFGDAFFDEEGRVDPYIVNLLSALPGAIYRYPGGALANAFEPGRAVGPLHERSAMTGHARRKVVARFGTDEFLEFVRSVGGVPLMVFNLVGPGEHLTSTASVIDEARQWYGDALQTRDLAGRPCVVVGGRCARVIWELGNELDFTPHNWSAAAYLERSSAVVDAIVAEHPNAVFIAHSATAPYSRGAAGARRAYLFNRDVAAGMAGRAQAMAVHAYFDGRPVADYLSYVKRVTNDMTAAGWQDPQIFITEYAKWRGNVGGFRADRPIRLAGAVSGADFLIAAMQMPEVKAAFWHVLGSEGPWRLFSPGAAGERPVAQAPYWALRVLADGHLPVILTTFNRSTNHANYDGGYDVRAVVATEHAEKPRFSVSAVNRSGRALWVDITIAGLEAGQHRVERREISGASGSLMNTAAQPATIEMDEARETLNVSADGRARVRLLPHSVTSLMIHPL